MSVLLREIRHFKADAARVLEQAGLRTDSDIQLLTREELHELFPRKEDLKLRRKIFDIIHKQTPVDQLLRDLKDFIPHDSFRAALTNNGVLVDYLRILKDMKTQMNNIQSFLDAHIGFLEELSTPRPDQESAAGSPVKPNNGRPDGRPQGPQGAQGAQDAFNSDSSHQMVLSTDQTGGHPQGAQGTGFLNSWIPSIFGGPQSTSTPATFGQGNYHYGQPVVPLQRAPDTAGTSVGSGQMVSFNDPAGGRPQGPQNTAGTSDGSGQIMPFTDPTGGRPQGAQIEEPFTILSSLDCMEGTLKYHMVVGGKTFGTHVKLMEKVKEQVQNLVQLRESETDHEITFVFCPISSRIASDVEAAMTDVKDDKPVILVLMHHTREAKYTTTMRTWAHDAKVVLHVNVFYHETINDLLKCDENNAAVTEIRKIIESFIQTHTVASGNAQGVGAESLTLSPSGRGGGNNKHSRVDKSTSGSMKWYNKRLH